MNQTDDVPVRTVYCSTHRSIGISLSWNSLYDRAGSVDRNATYGLAYKMDLTVSAGTLITGPLSGISGRLVLPYAVSSWTLVGLRTCLLSDVS